jgi:hypothetical protein
MNLMPFGAEDFGALQGPGPCVQLDQLSGHYARYLEFERGVSRRVYELSRGQSPYYNIAPLLELVRMAHSMGYDVVPQKPAG